MARVLSSVYATSTGSVCYVQHASYIVSRPNSHFMYTCVLFCDVLWPEVQSHSDDSHMHLSAPCSAPALGQTRSTMSCIHLVVFIRKEPLYMRVLTHLK